MIPGPLVQVIPPAVASNRIAQLLGPNAKFGMELAYGAPGFQPPSYAPAGTVWNPTTIIPWYFVKALVSYTNALDGTTNTIIDTTVIPATDNSSYVHPSLSMQRR